MQLSAEAREQSALLQQSIQRNRHLLEQLLSLARAQAPETQRPKTLISLQNQFRRVLQELMPLALAKGQDIGVAVENDCQIHADALKSTPSSKPLPITPSATPQRWPHRFGL